MPLYSEIAGLVRGVSGPRKFAEDSTNQFAMNNRGDMLMAQGLPERTDLVRLGNSWAAQIKEGNAFTLLITIPTTLAGLALQNGEATGGKAYVIDRVWVKDVTTTAAANYVTILGQMIQPGTALVADSANKTIQSLSGKPNYGGKAQIAVASSSVGALTDKWFILGSAGINQPTSTSIAAGYAVECFGRYVVPPQGTFALNAQEAVSGGTAILGVEWHEVLLDMAP